MMAGLASMNLWLTDAVEAQSFGNKLRSMSDIRALFANKLINYNLWSREFLCPLLRITSIEQI